MECWRIRNNFHYCCQYWYRPIYTQSDNHLAFFFGPVPDTDTTVGCQSSYTKVFASGGSFQNVCGE